jgi:hypothetical protein
MLGRRATTRLALAESPAVEAHVDALFAQVDLLAGIERKQPQGIPSPAPQVWVWGQLCVLAQVPRLTMHIPQVLV